MKKRTIGSKKRISFYIVYTTICTHTHNKQLFSETLHSSPSSHWRVRRDGTDGIKPPRIQNTVDIPSHTHRNHCEIQLPKRQLWLVVVLPYSLTSHCLKQQSWSRVKQGDFNRDGCVLELLGIALCLLVSLTAVYCVVLVVVLSNFFFSTADVWVIGIFLLSFFVYVFCICLYS